MDATHLNTFIDALIDELAVAPPPDDDADRRLCDLLDSPRRVLDEQPLLAVLSPLGRIAVMPRENRLLVVDYAANLDMVRKVLDRIDRPVSKPSLDEFVKTLGDVLAHGLRRAN